MPVFFGKLCKARTHHLISAEVLTVAGPSADQRYYEGKGSRVTYFEPRAQLRGWSSQGATLSEDHAPAASSDVPVAVQAVPPSPRDGHGVVSAATATGGDHQPVQQHSEVTS